MARVETIRSQVRRLFRLTPFRPFSLNMEDGDRIIIEHPENIAFDPTDSGSDEFHIVSNKLRYYGSFSAVTSLAELDLGQTAA